MVAQVAGAPDSNNFSSLPIPGLTECERSDVQGSSPWLYILGDTEIDDKCVDYALNFLINKGEQII